MPWGVAAAAVGAAGTIGGAAISSSAANAGSKAQQAAANQAINQQQKNLDLTEQNESPYLAGGANAESELQQLLGTYTGAFPTEQAGIAAVRAADPSLANVSNNDPRFVAELASLQAQNVASTQASDGSSYGSLLQPFTNADFQEQPGYQFALQQGQQALQRAQAAGGGLLSGAAVKALTDYNQGDADQQYQQAYENYNTNQGNVISRLTGQTIAGQNAASAIGNVSTNTANQVSDLNTQIGNAQSAADTSTGNAASSALSSLSNPLGTNAASNYLSSAGTGLNSTGYGTLNNPGTQNINFNPTGTYNMGTAGGFNSYLNDTQGL